MKVVVKTRWVDNIEALESRGDLQLVTDSQDVEAVKEHFGNVPEVSQFGGFLVDIEDGDYQDVYGFYGSVPGKEKRTYKITMEYVHDDAPKAKKKAKKPVSSKKRKPSGLGGVR
jgi:hypothetical protein